MNFDRFSQHRDAPMDFSPRHEDEEPDEMFIAGRRELEQLRNKGVVEKPEQPKTEENMTDPEFKDLEERAARLWNELGEVERPYKAKMTEWHAAHSQLQHERLKREVRAELAATGGN